MLPKPALLSSIEVPEPALSLSSAGLALLRVLAVSMYFIGTIPDNGTTQPALYSPPHCTAIFESEREKVIGRYEDHHRFPLVDRYASTRLSETSRTGIND